MWSGRCVYVSRASSVEAMAGMGAGRLEYLSRVVAFEAHRCAEVTVVVLDVRMS